MDKIYFTSDLHFNHNKPFIYLARGFQTVEEMNQTIINNWNNTIDDDDIIYVLGDLMLNGDVGYELIEKLNGNITIIRGNHDTDNRELGYCTLKNVDYIKWADMVHYGKWNFYCTHFPCAPGDLNCGKPWKQFTWNLCGHIHTKDKYAEMRKGIPSYHVELDAHNMKPIEISQIINDIKTFQEDLT